MRVWRATIGAVLICGLAAVPAKAAEKPRIIVLNLSHSDAKLELLARSLSEQILTELTRSQHVEAVGQSDLASVLGLERQKQLLGCTDESTSCLAEISAALGAPWLVSGSLARLGNSVRIDLKLIRTKDGAAIYRDGRSTDDEGQVFKLLASMVRDLVEGAGFSGSAPSSSGSANAGVPPLILLGVGVAALVAGGIVTGISSGQWRDLHDPTWTAKTSWVEVKSTGEAFNTGIIVGPSLMAVGVVAATAGLLWRLLLKPEPAVSLLFTGNGFALGGAF